MGFCSCSSKYILFFFNLGCALLGLAVLGIGVYGNISSQSYGGETTTTSIILIVFGCLVALIAFFGCWGAIQENRCLLNLYGAILLVLLIGLIALGSVTLVMKGSGEHNVARYIDKVFEQARNGESAAIKEVDVIQSGLHCCGLDGHSYWEHNGKPTPLSCCEGHNNGQFCDLEYVRGQKGCEKVVVYAYRGIVKLMGIFAITVGSVEFLAVFMAFFLSYSIRRQELLSYSS